MREDMTVREGIGHGDEGFEGEVREREGQICTRKEGEGVTNLRERRGNEKDKFARGERERERERKFCARGDGEGEKILLERRWRGRDKFAREEREREGQI